MSKKYVVVMALVALMPLSFVIAAKNPSSFFKASIISVLKAPEINSWKNSPSEVAKKVQEAAELLKEVTLNVGSEKIQYSEKRVLSDAGKITVSSQKFSDVEREITLVLMNEKTGELNAVKIIKRGSQLISPAGYQIQIEERMNGIRWNVWATQYKVVSPKNTIVLMNKYPVDKADGSVEYFTYSPYSPSLDKPETLREGAQYLQDVIEAARADLRNRQVMSHAVPGKLVVDVLPAEYFARLPFLEQSDLLEAMSDSEYSINRVLGTLSYNKGNAWTLSSNYAGANGWIQFTDNWRNGKPGTYTTLVRLYPEANLDANFKRGAADHVNSMKAAILLHDNNLGLLVNAFGSDIAKNPNLEEFLAASYNGPPSKVIKSLKAVGTSKETAVVPRTSWVDGLFTETEGYIAKLRMLTAKGIPGKFLD